LTVKITRRSICRQVEGKEARIERVPFFVGSGLDFTAERGRETVGKNSHLGWRHAGTGKFISEKKAESLPQDKVIHERIPNPGKGTSK
jgi:hypothetical protein